MKRQAYQEAAIYVGTYGKYAEGSIFGKWLSLADFSDYDEFIDACKALHADEQSPELMFQDWEYIPEGFISECSLNPTFFELRDELTADEEEAFTEWINYTGEPVEDAEKAVERFRDAYCGEWNSEEVFAEELFSECYEVPENIRYYIDYQAFARDLFMCDYFYTGGYVFRNI